MTVTVRKIPALRFPEFEGEWEEKKLGLCATKIGSGSTPRGGESVYQKSGIPFIRSQNVGNDRLDLSRVTFISEEINAQMNGTMVQPLDVLLNITGASIGRSCVVPESFECGNVNQHVCIIRLKKNYSPFFIQAKLSSFAGQKAITRNQVGGSREGLNFQSVRLLKLDLPSFSEQQKIATFLSTIDTRIQQLSRKKALLEQYKKGVMQQVFSQEIRFKDEDGKEFPAWEEKKLGEAFTFCQTNSFSRSLLNYERGAVKNIHYGDIHTKFPTIFDLSKEEVPFVNESIDLSKIADENYCKVGDLIIADASEDYKDIGKAIEVVNLAGQTLIAGLHTLIVRDVKNQTATGFKGYLMQTPKVRQQIMRTATGISVLGISKGNLSKVKLFLPSLPEQQKITAFLSAIDRQINLVSQQLNQMQAFKKGLLQQMFV